MQHLDESEARHKTDAAAADEDWKVILATPPQKTLALLWGSQLAVFTVRVFSHRKDWGMLAYNLL